MGTVFLGENFRSCVSIAHQARHEMKKVGVKIEMQTSTNRTTLLETPSDQMFDFGFGDARDYIVEHRMNETGVNCIVCCVVYDDIQGQQQSLQKFFKFQVTSAIILQTKLHQREDLLYAEMLVKSEVSRPIFLESVKFLPNPLFTVEDMNEVQLDEQGGAMSTFGDVAPLEPNMTRSYLFRIRSKSSKASNMAHSLGQFELQWRSLLGETGRMVSSTICKDRDIKQNQSFDYELSLVAAPALVVLETPFEVTFCVQSNCNRPLDLRLVLQKEKMGLVLPVGLSSRSVGVLEPHESKLVTVTLLALGLGVHRIMGFRLLCPKENSSVELDGGVPMHHVEVEYTH
jgi:hypothetical protein